MALFPNPLVDDPELLREFIQETREHLASIELDISTLARDPTNAEAIQAIFRCFHNLKGTSGFLDLAALHEVADEMETALNLVRSGDLAISAPLIDRILRSKDYVSCWIMLQA